MPITMPRQKVGPAQSLQPEAFKIVFESLLETNHPDLAVAALMQSQLGERCGCPLGLHWDDVHENACGDLEFFVRAVNGKTIARPIGMNKGMQKWFEDVKSGELVHYAQTTVVDMNGKRTRVFKSQWPKKKDKSNKLMFPRVEGNYYARVMREEVKPLLRARKESSIDVKRCLHGINLNRVRTHSFRRGSVSYM